MKKQIYINGFQKGASQSPNVGTGAIVGFDAYSKPGVVILGKKIASTFALPNTNEYVTYMDISNNSNSTPSIAASARLWAQSNFGIPYYSDDYGTTWHVPTFTGIPPSGVAAGGNGLIVYENYVFIFYLTEIWYTEKTHKADSAAPNFIQWKTGIDNGTVASGTSPIYENHFPFLFPNNRGVYFANNNAVGFFGQVFPVGNATPTDFDPSGAANTDYLYNRTLLTLPQNYSVNTLDFLPPSNLAIGSNNIYSGQEADIMTWDTISANKFSAPIKIFSGTNINGAQGVKQIINRLNVAYIGVGGNHAMYSTNGGTANIIADLSLYSNVRNVSVNANGKEYPVPIYYNSYPNAISVSGNKVLAGTGTSIANSYFSAGTGVFPTGMWSVYFNNDGSTMEQMEYSIPFSNGAIGSVSSFSATGDFSAITSIKPLANGQTAVAYASKLGGSITIGSVSIFDNVNYIQDKTLTSLESELFEIGTALNPSTPEKIEINLTKNLLSDQQVEISYRTATDQNWTVIQTFTGDGTRNHYSIQQHPISAAQYVQLRCRANTGVTNPTDTIELRSISIS